MVKASSRVAPVTAVVTYVNSEAEVVIDYTSKNQYFDADSISLSEDITFNITKVFADSIVVTELLGLDRTINIADSVTASEVLSTAMVYNRSISDTVSPIDLAIDEYTDGPILNEFMFNSEPFLAGPISSTALTTIIT
jgi:hypothetical protein